MNKFLKQMALFLVVLSLMLIMTSCKYSINSEEAQLYLNDFLSAIEAHDYETMVDLFHSEHRVPTDFFQDFIEREESEDNIDFSLGVTLKEITKREGAVYDSKVNGAYRKLSLQIVIGTEDENVLKDMTITFVKNANGFGIWDFSM